MRSRWARLNRELPAAEYLAALRWRARRAADLEARAREFGYEDSAVFWGREAERLAAEVAGLEPEEEPTPPK